MDKKRVWCSGPKRDPRHHHRLSNIPGKPKKSVTDQAACFPSGLHHRSFHGGLEVSGRGLEEHLNRFLGVVGENLVLRHRSHCRAWCYRSLCWRIGTCWTPRCWRKRTSRLGLKTVCCGRVPEEELHGNRMGTPRRGRVCCPSLWRGPPDSSSFPNCPYHVSLIS